ncbi:MAG: hypothetical protein IJE46_05070 [Clostridia bacterium]|nr:hypothetical protein [Clostridia bacterium]
MNVYDFYIPIYEMFDGITPLSKDCGKLCDSACCKDGEEKTGMLLFPHEEKLLSNVPFAEIEDSNCEFGEKEVAKLFFCEGHCNRKFRPLACRIFPLMPYLKNGKIKLIMNPMAKNICPLARSLKPKDLEPAFVKNVKKAMNRVLKLKDGRDYILMLSEIADDFTSLNNKFTK